jgi:outer membrane protein assembly factor BamB
MPRKNKQAMSISVIGLARSGLARLCALLVLWGSAHTSCADWTGFRNDGGSQVECQLPTAWSPTNGIAWQRELPGYGQSSPVILNEKVFVTAVEGPMKERLLVLCISLTSGQTLWSYELAATNQAASNFMASRAAPTPVVDEGGVYAFFESGDCVAVDHAGSLLWHRDLTADYGRFDNNHGLGSSPAHNATHIFLNIEHKGPSYLLSLDKTTGLTSWKVERGSTSSWSSPIVAQVQGHEQVIVSSGGNVTSYRAANGDKVWSLDGLDGNSVPSPTVIGERLFIGARLPEFSEEGSIRSNCCIDLSDLHEGVPKVLWRAEKALSDYASPAVCEQFAYFVNKAGVLYCLDTASGQVHYAQRLGTQCWATPIIAQSMIYFFGKDGKTQILKAGAEHELLASNALWDEDNPPKPETYVEHTGGHGHGGAGPNGPPGSGSRRAAGGGMLAALKEADKDGDGVLAADEIPADFKPMLARIDSNGDGRLDQEELKAMADSFAARRSDSQTTARDPIVYGAAASQGKIVIRTGTRLYCIQ